ncbi:hypothetical protein AB205_0173580, partial [Aquarana catesbeiana]
MHILIWLMKRVQEQRTRRIPSHLPLLCIELRSRNVSF